MKVAVYGASQKINRYSNKVIRLLKRKGYEVYPINPTITKIEGLDVFPNLAAISQPIHTLTIYLNPARQKAVFDDIVNGDLKRVIFNPGTENKELTEALEKKGIEVLNVCTLVMLQVDGL